jgi:outer membrane protein OmpA-like peptidoglycan-associated protein
MSKGILLGETNSDEYGKYMLRIPAGFSEAEVFVIESIEGYKRQMISSSSIRYEEFEVDFSAEQKLQKKEEVLSIDSMETNELETVIYFEFDRFDMANDESSKLKKILEIMNPSSVVYIVGHTDHVGSNQYNIELSEKRAEAVKDWIIEFSGLNENQFIITFKGESKVLNSGTTSKERSKNRRVSVKVLNH